MSDHDHDHDEFHEPTDSEVRAKAVESLLAEKGLLSTDAVNEIVNQYENDVGPMNGARVVARAWTDPEYKRRLLENGGDAVAELGYGDEHSARLVVVENTREYTTSSFAPCVHATLGPSSASRRHGTSRRRTARES